MKMETPYGAGGFTPMSEINVTPFIDVMLVLLIIFMVTAPLMMGGVPLNLPKTAGQPLPRLENPLVVSLDAENRVFVGQDEVAAGEMREHFKTLARESLNGEVYVRGDGEVKYARMMELMTDLGQAGFARVTLASKVTGGADAPAAQSAAKATGLGDEPPAQLTAKVTGRTH